MKYHVFLNTLGYALLDEFNTEADARYFAENYLGFAYTII